MTLAVGLGATRLLAGRNGQPADQGQRQDGTQKDSHKPQVCNRGRKSHL